MSRGRVPTDWKIAHVTLIITARLYLAWLLAVNVCPSVCLSVTRRYCVETVKHRITQTTPRDSPGTLVFWSLATAAGGRRPVPPETCTQSDPPTSEHNDFDQYRLIVPQPWELAKNIQLALIGSWPRAFQRAIARSTVYVTKSPKGGTKRDFAVFASKIQLLSKEVFCKVSLCENLQRQNCGYNHYSI